MNWIKGSIHKYLILKDLDYSVSFVYQLLSIYTNIVYPLYINCYLYIQTYLYVLFIIVNNLCYCHTFSVKLINNHAANSLFMEEAWGLPLYLPLFSRWSCSFMIICSQKESWNTWYNKEDIKFQNSFNQLFYY
jgi:hypothetical protein